MSMRNHSIDSAYSFFDELYIGYVNGEFQRETMVDPITQSRQNGALVNDRMSVRRQIGSAMMRTGGFILAVPDPLPFVDEVVGAGLLFGGALMYIDRRGTIPEGKSYYGYYERGDDGKWRRSRR